MKADISYYLAMKLSKDSSVLILSHFYKRTQSGGGPPQEIRDFFLPKVKSIYYIEHPVPYATDHRSSMTVYENGAFKRQLFTPSLVGPQIVFYMLDPLITLYFLIRARVGFDLCVALDNLNTVSVLPFKKVGIIKKLVFYTIDYNPKRFENKTLNSIYHFIDRLACYHSDKIWILSEKMITARKKNGVNPKKTAPSIDLPMGANLERIKILPLSKIKRKQIVYAGYLLEKQGVQLIIESMPKIISLVSDAKFVIIGQGEFEKPLKALVRKLKLERHVEFKGFIKTHEGVEKILCQSAIGIAPYVTDSDSYTQYTDPGKPKLYLGCGLPVVITDVPQVARVISSKKAGVVIDYSVKSAIKALITLFSNDRLYKEYRKNAIELSKKYNTNSLIANALDKTN